MSGEANWRILALSQPAHTRSMLEVEGYSYAHNTMHHKWSALSNGVWWHSVQYKTQTHQPPAHHQRDCEDVNGSLGRRYWFYIQINAKGRLLDSQGSRRAKGLAVPAKRSPKECTQDVRKRRRYRHRKQPGLAAV